MNALLALIDRLLLSSTAEPWDKKWACRWAHLADVGSLLVALDADETALAEAERRGCDAVGSPPAAVPALRPSRTKATRAP